MEAMEIEELWSWDEEEGERFLITLCEDSVDEEFEEYLLTQVEVDHDSSVEDTTTTRADEKGVNILEGAESCLEAPMITPPQEDISKKGVRVTSPKVVVTNLGVGSRGEDGEGTCIEALKTTPPQEDYSKE